MTGYDPFLAQLHAEDHVKTPAEAFEEEKSHITSYEEGWDEWDGPIWPWKNEVKFNMPETEKTTAAHHAAGMRDVSPPEKHPGDH